MIVNPRDENEIFHTLVHCHLAGQAPGKYLRGALPKHYPVPAKIHHISWQYFKPDADRGLKGGVVLVTSSRPRGVS